MISRIERGIGGRMSLDVIDDVAQALGSRVDVRLSWQGEGLDRLLDRDHAQLVEATTRLLRASAWDVRTEVTFAVRGERGSVDLLGWHPASMTLLIVEVKSVVPDVQATLATFDRKGRLGREIAATIGWRPRTIARLLVINATRTSRRRIEAHEATFAAALPHRLVNVRRFIAEPSDEPLRGLIFLPASPRAPARHRQAAWREAARA